MVLLLSCIEMWEEDLAFRAGFYMFRAGFSLPRHIHVLSRYYHNKSTCVHFSVFCGFIHGLEHHPSKVGVCRAAHKSKWASKIILSCSRVLFAIWYLDICLFLFRESSTICSSKSRPLFLSPPLAFNFCGLWFLSASSFGKTLWT